MRSTIRRSGRGRLLATTLALAVPLTLGTAACSEEEGAGEGVVEEGVGEEGVGVEEEEQDD